MGGPVKPSGYVGWCSTGATNGTVEPTDSKKASGFATSEKPPAQYLNWLLQKQDQWIQYLDWRTRLVPVVDDSFTYSTQAGFNSVTQRLRPSGLSPYWNISPSTISAANGLVVGYEPGGAGFSGLEYISKSVMGPTGGFVLEAGIVGFHDDFIGRSGLMRVGIHGFVEFMATGVTGFWGLHYVASGRSPTSIGMSHATASGAAAFAVTARGPTMIIEKNGQQLYALPYAPVGVSSASGDGVKTFGVQVQMYGTDGQQGEVSYLRYLKSPAGS